MASSNGQAHPFRTLSAFAVLLVTTYLLVFFTGDGDPTPKLGVDLQGGTRVTLTARTPDGQAPSQDSLRQAQGIIESRINGLGVAGSEVIIDGDNLVITVPGQDGARARTLGQTARMFIRPVLEARPGMALVTPEGTPAEGGTPAGEDVDPAEETIDPAPAEPTAENTVPEGQQQPQGRPVPAPLPAQVPTETAPAPPAPDAPAPEETTPVESPAPEPEEPLTETQRKAQEITAARELRQSDDPAVQAEAMATLDCSKPDPLAGNDAPDRPLVACDGESGYVYLLAPSIIEGTEIDSDSVSSGFNSQQARWEVSFRFKSTGDRVWAQHTRDNIGQQTAFVLDTAVVSAPVIQEPTPEGSATSISGSFTQATAQDLANSLKYGSLPLSFDTSDAQTVSATLGYSSLQAGLIAGAVGFAIVLLYCLVYYRVLGLLASGSLLLAGLMVYGILVLLGRYINFTLDLAGIAGLIIGIGMTADSFVVFFERIKDEMREGRSFRSAVPRGWGRAQRTIFSGNAVSFIGAAVLYVLAIGQVKGFAFTLGLTTLLDLLVVYMVTFPLVLLATRSRFMSDPKLNGLGAITQVAKEQRAAASAEAESDAVEAGGVRA